MLKSSKGKDHKHVKGGQGTKFTDRDLRKVNPMKEQFEPTEAAAIRQHKRMGGVS